MAAESIINRKALRDYHILERYEAGIALKGSEVKSVRAGKANISDAFARIENGEAFVYNADIQPYEKASHEIPIAKRVRKLLLHRQEIDKLYGETQVAGLQQGGIALPHPVEAGDIVLDVSRLVPVARPRKVESKGVVGRESGTLAGKKEENDAADARSR